MCYCFFLNLFINYNTVLLFHFGEIMNKTAFNIHIQTLVLTYSSGHWYGCPEREFSALWLTLKRLLIVFSIQIAQLKYQNCVKYFLFKQLHNLYGLQFALTVALHNLLYHHVSRFSIIMHKHFVFLVSANGLTQHEFMYLYISIIV